MKVALVQLSLMNILEMKGALSGMKVGRVYEEGKPLGNFEKVGYKFLRKQVVGLHIILRIHIMYQDC